MELEEHSCRICLEPGERRDFIAPCSCKGTQKWVHRSCLDRWRIAREDKAFSRCTECQKEYTLISLVDDSPAHERKRKCEFVSYIAHDISLGIIGIHVLIFLFGSMVWFSDGKTASLLTTFHMTRHPIVFYYLAGIAWFLVIAGLVFMVNNLTGGGCCSSGGNDILCLDAYYLGGYGTGYDAGANSFCCMDCAHVGCCNEGCSTGCAECGAGCSDCSIASAGAEVALVLFLLLAVIGLIVAVFVGMYFTQLVIQKHVHLLQKRGLAKDFIVADLDALDAKYDVESQQDHEESSSVINNPLRPQTMFRNTHSSHMQSDDSITTPSYELVQLDDSSHNSSQLQSSAPTISNLTPQQQQHLSSLGLI